MCDLMKYMLLLTAIIVSGCRSQSCCMSDEICYPPWRTIAESDSIDERQKSIIAQFSSQFSREIPFQGLRYDKRSGLEYYIYSTHTFEGQLIVYTVDSTDNIVMNLGYYNGRDGWVDLKINPYHLDLFLD